MARLIDADALLELVQFRLPIDNQNAEVIAGCVDITRRLIENAPTVDAVDAVPVVHGRWIEGRGSRYICSVCKVNAGLHSGGIGQNLSNYCPNCGAKMDGERSEGE